MAVKPTVTRRYGSTYVSAWADQDVKDAALALCAWLRFRLWPENGQQGRLL